MSQPLLLLSLLSLSFSTFPFIATERLFLRQLSPRDVQEFFLLRTDERVVKYIIKPRLKTIDEALKKIDFLNVGITENKWVFWAISFKNSNKLIGTICLWNISVEEESGEVGFDLLPEYQNKGIMSEALDKVIGYGFETVNLKQLTGWAHKDNTASIKLMEKFGFVYFPDYKDKKKEHPDLRVYMLSKLKC